MQPRRQTRTNFDFVWLVSKFYVHGSAGKHVCKNCSYIKRNNSPNNCPEKNFDKIQHLASRKALQLKT